MRKKPNPKPTIDDVCAICGTPYAMTHEIFYGRTGNARHSQDYGMTIRLCHLHHQDHKEGIHHNRAFDLRIKKEYQQIFEAEHGHDKFMEVFGRSYL